MYVCMYVCMYVYVCVCLFRYRGYCQHGSQAVKGNKVDKAQRGGVVLISRE
jgi:hypothetical protein